MEDDFPIWERFDVGVRKLTPTYMHYKGGHGMGKPKVPNTPHAHIEFLRPTGKGNFVVTKNVHVPLKIGTKPRGC